MIPFTVLQAQADRVAEVTGQYTSISIDYVRNPSGKAHLHYLFYQEDFPNTIKFKTVQELQAAMDAIITPPDDVGVLVEG